MMKPSQAELEVLLDTETLAESCGGLADRAGAFEDGSRRNCARRRLHP